MALESKINANSNVMLEYKRLGRVRGFFCHLAMVYHIFFPFLKGFHLTLSQHLFQRDEEGWKLTDLQWIGYIGNKVESGTYTQTEADGLISGMHNPE